MLNHVKPSPIPSTSALPQSRLELPGANRNTHPNASMRRGGKPPSSNYSCHVGILNKSIRKEGFLVGWGFQREIHEFMLFELKLRGFFLRSSSNSWKCGWVALVIWQSSEIIPQGMQANSRLVGGIPTPLKNISRLGWWHFQYMEK